MSLADLAAIGSFLSGVGVLITLPFLVVQLRQLNFQAQQNTKHTKALIYQGGGARASSQFLSMADADLAEAMIVGNGGAPTPAAIKELQFRMMWQTHYITWDDNFSQHRDGLISDELFERLRAILIEHLRANPGYVRLYRSFIGTYTPGSGFHVFLGEACSEAASPVVDRSSGEQALKPDGATRTADEHSAGPAAR